jgi:hypothetical protein
MELNRSPKRLNHEFDYIDMVRVLIRLTALYTDVQIHKGEVDMSLVRAPVTHTELISYFSYTDSMLVEARNLPIYRRKFHEHLKTPTQAVRFAFSPSSKTEDVVEFFRTSCQRSGVEFQVPESLDTVFMDPVVWEAEKRQQLVQFTLESDELKYPYEQREYFQLGEETYWEPKEGTIECYRCKKVLTVSKTKHYRSECKTTALCGKPVLHVAMSDHSRKCKKCNHLRSYN